MNKDALKVIGTGLMAAAAACTLGIGFFSTTKKIGQAIVDVSDRGINMCTSARNTLGDNVRAYQINAGYPENAAYTECRCAANPYQDFYRSLNSR